MALDDDKLAKTRYRSPKTYRYLTKVKAKRNDSWQTIARRNKLSVDELTKMNPKVYRLSPGQTVKVPRQPPSNVELEDYLTLGPQASLENIVQNVNPYIPIMTQRGALSQMQLINQMFPPQPFAPATRGGNRGIIPDYTSRGGATNPAPYWWTSGLTKFGVSPSTLGWGGVTSPSYTNPAYWVRPETGGATTGGWRDAGAGGRGAVGTANPFDFNAEWQRQRAERLARMGYGGRWLAEVIEGRQGSPNMKPLVQEYADYVFVDDDGGGGISEDTYGGGGWGGWGGGGYSFPSYGGGGGGYGGYGLGTSGPFGRGYEYRAPNYSWEIGLINWRI